MTDINAIYNTSQRKSVNILPPAFIRLFSAPDFDIIKTIILSACA